MMTQRYILQPLPSFMAQIGALSIAKLVLPALIPPEASSCQKPAHHKISGWVCNRVSDEALQRGRVFLDSEPS